MDRQTISIKVVYLQKLGVSAWLGYQTKSLADSLRKAARSRIQLKLNIICTILKDWPGLCDSSLNAQNLKNKTVGALRTSSYVLYLEVGEPDPVVVGGESHLDAKRPFSSPRQGDE